MFIQIFISVVLHLVNFFFPLKKLVQEITLLQTDVGIMLLLLSPLTLPILSFIELHLLLNNVKSKRNHHHEFVIFNSVKACLT